MTINIRDSTAYVGSGTDIWATILYENSYQQLLRFAAARWNSAGSCSWDYTQALIKCVQPSPGDRLKSRVKALVNLGGLFNYACMLVYDCKSGANCAGLTCANWGADYQYMHIVENIPVHAAYSITPNVPTGLVITPGSGSLRIQWNAVTNTEIFAYYVAILFGGAMVKSGYTLSNERDITITGLTNGASYSIEIRAVNYNDEAGNPTTGSGTPGVACPTPTVSIGI